MVRAVITTLLDDSHAGTADHVTRYAPSGWQKTFFAIVFLILLPFWGSLPAMLYQRFAAGIWLDTWGLIVIAAAFTVLMALVLFELIYSLRAEVELGETALRFTLPMGGPGKVPMFNYRTHEIAYDEIAAVECRSEVYGGSLAPVLMGSTWLRLRDGKRLLLGATHESDVDHTFPFRKIADQIAARAGVQVAHLGCVKRPVRDAVLGLKGHEIDGTPLPEEAIAELNMRHRNIVFALISILALMIGMSMATDILNAGVDLGERAPNTALPFRF